MREIGGSERQQGRRKRIARLKKMIVGTVLAAIILPTILCIVLFVKLINANKQLEQLTGVMADRAARDAETAAAEETVAEEKAVAEEETVEASIFSTAQLEESMRAATMKTVEAAQTGEDPEDGPMRLYLTFDDGPSSNTNVILDILKIYDIKATFFVTGKTDEQSLQAYRRIVEEGHTLGMHSYSHSYQDIYDSVERFGEDLTRLQEHLYEVTGVWCRYYRFPGGSSNQVSKVEMQDLIDYLNRQDIRYFDWNIGSGDAAGNTLAAARITDNCLNGMKLVNSGIILLHDSPVKQTTVEALPMIIEGILAAGDTVLLPIDDDTPLVQHVIAHQD